MWKRDPGLKYDATTETMGHESTENGLAEEKGNGARTFSKFQKLPARLRPEGGRLDHRGGRLEYAWKDTKHDSRMENNS